MEIIISMLITNYQLNDYLPINDNLFNDMINVLKTEKLECFDYVLDLIKIFGKRLYLDNSNEEGNSSENDNSSSDYTVSSSGFISAKEV